MKRYLCFIGIISLAFNLCSCNSIDNYTLTGRCEEWKMPEDGIVYLSVLDLRNDDMENMLKRTRVEKDGTFKFSGYVKEPQIVYVCSINHSSPYNGFTFHGMCILEDGDIEMDCEIFERNRSFIDCVGRGTPTNDRIRNFYSAQDSIIRECMANGDEMVYSSYPEVEKHQIEYINRNKNDFSSVFLAIDALRSGSSIEDIPDEIVNNKFVKAYIETCPKTEDTFSSIIEEEIIPIHVD